MIPAGREFYKMSGSGNDFVFVDARREPPGGMQEPAMVRAVCARGTGVGADGLVFLETSTAASIAMRYLNSDGSPAAVCGNATLCAARLFVELGGAPMGHSFTVDVGSSVLRAVLDGARPTVDMPAVEDLQSDIGVRLRAGERRAGFARVGIPHLVVLCDRLDEVDVHARGRPLRFDPMFSEGTNVDFVGRGPDGRWHMRTYERGVEAETLACGTGAVATAAVLSTWGTPAPDGVIMTTSGKALAAALPPEGSHQRPTLTGEARVVYRGYLAEF